MLMGGIKKIVNQTWYHSSLAHSIVREAMLLKGEQQIQYEQLEVINRMHLFRDGGHPRVAVAPYRVAMYFCLTSANWEVYSSVSHTDKFSSEVVYPVQAHFVGL